MRALEILGNEHALIRQYLDSLALAVEKIETGGHPPVEFFDKALEFYNTFTKQFHHFKEEYAMFVKLAQKKNGKIDTQLDALRYQHERGRNYMVEIAGALEGYSRGNELHTTKLLENLAAYISLLRQHIHKEDHIFYPMVEKVLTEQEHEDLLELFRVEDDKRGGEIFERSKQQVREMGTLV